MDAIMVTLVAVLLANADGRSGCFLARLLGARADRRAVVAVALGSFVVNALLAALLGAIANRMIGQGIVALLVGFALVTAAAALLWRGRLTLADEQAVTAPLPLLAGRMLLVQIGDRSHFLIGALAATSGAGLWAAAGGAIGWTLAALPFLAFGPDLAARPAARVLRWASAAILLLWGLRSGLTAFGL
ncbi:TMEM165/GDT1 family protein [Sphingopyxis panaciterrulae]|uniref:Putative Ca2+/H+ antiporter (TMEM165/GDT1 family) n=1 Tax=Sphingopyxis panaciterrulae TaxID=462372 RepID=A0A7W9B2K0_9SPHN|nr:TMEM165/GDT1 family protein [Sphingopyxis panaciterrulae]MBB5705038.1 putative Ca2+/H+ antiporter (TMEM165/GDT1 family) [Sphingopyxis panaciterrulae]